MSPLDAGSVSVGVRVLDTKATARREWRIYALGAGFGCGIGVSATLIISAVVA